MFHIAICDSSLTDSSKLEESLEKAAEVFGENYEIEVFLTTSEFFRSFETISFDLIFLEADMEDGSGIETGKRIREQLHNDTVQIIYTAYAKNCAMKLFKSRPMDFLIKPLSFSDVFDSLCILKRLLIKKSAYFEYQAGYSLYKIPFSEILYFENSKRKINILTVQGKSSFYGNMEQTARLCKAHPFTQIHKSYLVNADYIVKYEYNQVTLSDGTLLPISQPNRKRIRTQRLRHEQGRTSDVI
ncbi:LytTR family DNA-binding domain-containing protein [Anaerocolumna sp. AGMB13025]|uniref:LytR/AlgR family response regulator transcription factor n=1 Tax=Anaerocolumna sp. AGMB13025 TaxID=3039116 RepID=UPI00241DE9DD|nr:LytTR family DNA-binding domain-containing protein [Anaerocolumna sp. AGMB13025]WFR57731.1 LytTR family DNA-binding domain-containing protein [Anaerocolumna sp. AGMB13025]